MADEKELRETLEGIKRKLMVMEWDKNHNQLNSGKLGIYHELAETKLKLETEISSVTTVAEIEKNSEVTKIE
jgi:hypothetical protein